MERRKNIAVVGSAECGAGEQPWDLAFELGRRLVDCGYRVVSGGLGGVMEAALAGARTSQSYAEGDTIAILPDFSPDRANTYADIVIATGIDVHMNGIVANAQAVVAVGGGAGTLSEIAAAWERGRPLLTYAQIPGSSQLIARLRVPAGSPLYPVTSAEEVVGVLAEIWKEERQKPCAER